MLTCCSSHSSYGLGPHEMNVPLKSILHVSQRILQTTKIHYHTNSPSPHTSKFNVQAEPPTKSSPPVLHGASPTFPNTLFAIPHAANPSNHAESINNLASSPAGLLSHNSSLHPVFTASGCPLGLKSTVSLLYNARLPNHPHLFHLSKENSLTGIPCASQSTVYRPSWRGEGRTKGRSR